MQWWSFVSNLNSYQQRSHLCCKINLIWVFCSFPTSFSTCSCRYFCTTVRVPAREGCVWFDCSDLKTAFAPSCACVCVQLILPCHFQLRNQARWGGTVPSWHFPLNTMHCRWLVTTHTGSGNTHTHTHAYRLTSNVQHASVCVYFPELYSNPPHLHLQSASPVA